MPASSIPSGPIILPTLEMVVTSPAGSVMCSANSSAAATMAIRFRFVTIFFRSMPLSPRSTVQQWVHSSTSCTMMNPQEYTTYSLPSVACSSGMTSADALE